MLGTGLGRYHSFSKCETKDDDGDGHVYSSGSFSRGQFGGWMEGMGAQ